MAQMYEFFVSLHYPAGMKTIRICQNDHNNASVETLHCTSPRFHRKSYLCRANEEE